MNLPNAKADVLSIRHTHQARRDLIDIWLDIAVENPAAADRIFDRLEARVKILEQFPELGPTRPDIDPSARVLVESHYLILYRITPCTVQIVRVLHGKRHIDSVLFNAGLE